MQHTAFSGSIQDKETAPYTYKYVWEWQHAYREIYKKAIFNNISGLSGDKMTKRQFTLGEIPLFSIEDEDIRKNANLVHGMKYNP